MSSQRNFSTAVNQNNIHILNTIVSCRKFVNKSSVVWFIISFFYDLFIAFVVIIIDFNFIWFHILIFYILLSQMTSIMCYYFVLSFQIMIKMTADFRVMKKLEKLNVFFLSIQICIDLANTKFGTKQFSICPLSSNFFDILSNHFVLSFSFYLQLYWIRTTLIFCYQKEHHHHKIFHVILFWKDLIQF